MTYEKSIKLVERLDAEGFDLFEFDFLKRRETCGLRKDQWERLQKYERMIEDAGIYD